MIHLQDALNRMMNNANFHRNFHDSNDVQIAERELRFARSELERARTLASALGRDRAFENWVTARGKRPGILGGGSRPLSSVEPTIWKSTTDQD